MHQLTTPLFRGSQALATEDLAVRKLGNRKLSRATSDFGWAILEYCLMLNERNFLEI